MVPFNNDEDGMLSNIHPLVHIRPPPRPPSIILMILLWFLLLPFSMVLKKISRSIDSSKSVKRYSYYPSKKLHYESEDAIYVKKLDYESSDSSDFPSSLEHPFRRK